MRYVHVAIKLAVGPTRHNNPDGFVVKGAPWDMNSQNDFPDLGGGSAGPKATVPWGPSFKR